MKVCPNCSAEFEDQLNFCRHDGTPLESKVAGKPCPKCGKELGEEPRFCRHCGASVESVQDSEMSDTQEPPDQKKEKKDQPEAAEESLTQRAENYLREKNYQQAISTLDSVIKTNPDNQEARLLYLFASVKLYNIYGYEKQIESIKLLPKLSEKEREIAREIYLIAADEAQKHRKEDEAREYQRMATRVILGQPAEERSGEAREEEKPAPKVEIKPVPQRAGKRVQVTPKATPRMAGEARSHSGNPARTKKKSSRLFVSFILVFGLAGVLAAGMLSYYAKKQGVEIRDLFGTKSPAGHQGEEGAGVPDSSVDVQVLGAEELGFKVSGTGAADANRQEPIIRESIYSQLADLSQLYQQELQYKPDLMGSVTLQLTISPSGAVTKVEEVASRVKDKEFKKSVIDEAYKWRFPEAGSGLVKVTYPLLFAPPGMDVATLIKWEQVTGVKEPEPEKPTEPTAVRETRKTPEPDAAPTARLPQVADVPPVRPTPKPQPSQPTKVVKKRIIIGPYEVLYPTYVYSEPREDSRKVAHVRGGIKINVVDVHGEWLEVRSKHGNPPGFIKKDSAVPWGSR